MNGMMTKRAPRTVSQPGRHSSNTIRQAIERHRHEIEACSSIIGNAVGNLRVAEEKEVLHILHQDDEHQDAYKFFQPRAWLANEYPRHHQVEHQTHAIDEEKQLHLAHR